MLMILCWIVMKGVYPFSIPVANTVRLETAPLIGGPSWLPVHVKVVVDDVHVFDFVPRNATSPETLQKLLSFQSVPAEARSKRRVSPNNNEPSETSNGANTISTNTLYSERASQFCQHYTKDLHLIENNCWTFALDLVRFILMEVGDR